MPIMQNGCAVFGTYLNPALGPMLITPDVIIVQPLNLSMFVSSMLSFRDIPAHSAEQKVVPCHTEDWPLLAKTFNC